MLIVIKTSIPLYNGLYLLWQQCLLLQHARPGALSPVVGSACTLQLKQDVWVVWAPMVARLSMLSTTS